jgi:transcriptional regulator of acetoin/glycerol metabolism
MINGDVQPVVAKSWLKCRRYGVDSRKGLGKYADEKVFKSILEENKLLLETAQPIMQSVFEIVSRSHFLLVLTDSVGYVLKTIGDQTIAYMAKELRFEPGALWSDLDVGSNAIGIALDYDTAIQMTGPEHYCMPHHGWTCSASPIHGPQGEVVGCLNMSGTCDDTHPHTLGLVVAAASGIETQLLSQHSNSLMHTALDGNSDSMLLLDNQFHPIWVNREAVKLLEMTPEILATMDFRRMMPDIEWDHVQEWEKRGQLYTSDTPLHINGKTVYCSATISPTLQPDHAKTFSVTLKKQVHVIRALNIVSGNQAAYTFQSIYAHDPVMKKAVAMAQKYARYEGIVLIEGESGTGKELFAQAIHNGSERANGPFVAINCASLPRDLVESELFGYEKGSFTGALKGGNPGKFEIANQGTIFLDEIGEMPLEFQAKLLRIVETRMVRRLGATQEKTLDVRIIAATNRKLKREVDMGRFREDLYFRLNVLKLEIPPLRERTEDVLYCAQRFLDHFNNRYPDLRKTMNADFANALRNHSWPGNVRELQNSIERAFFACSGGTLDETVISLAIDSHLRKFSAVSVHNGASLSPDILETLTVCGGNVEEAAKMCGFSRASMYRHVKKAGINPKTLRS